MDTTGAGAGVTNNNNGSTLSDSFSSPACGSAACWHGECSNGTCVCEIQFGGSLCNAPNHLYFAAFAVTFALVGAVCLTQLVLCVRAEAGRMKSCSLAAVCRVTVQKTLYIVTGAAAILRAVYFAVPENIESNWVSGLLSAFYAVLLTGSSLIVCFWAEVFHLNDIRWDRPRFLTKSLLGFMTFNIITYSVLAAEIAFAVSESTEKAFFSQVFNGCYAVLLFVVFVFFLIYGVEVYFKVRGKFVPEPRSMVNTSQLHQSRLGLVSQALMLLIVVAFLFSDILGQFWKYKVTLLSRNVHQVLFHVMEVGVALWFPCVLWNSIRPEQLWVLNPKQILCRGDPEPTLGLSRCASTGTASDLALATGDGAGAPLVECWVCYESGCTAASGPLIEPCCCSGSTGVVHHECLRRWLVECSERRDARLHCRVCGEQYTVEEASGDGSGCSRRLWLCGGGGGVTAQHWLRSSLLVTVMSVTGGAAWCLMRVYLDSWVRTATIGAVFIIYYICLRLLGLNCLSACQRVRVSSLNILNHRERQQQQQQQQASHTNSPALLNITPTGLSN